MGGKKEMGGREEEMKGGKRWEEGKKEMRGREEMDERGWGGRRWMGEGREEGIQPAMWQVNKERAK